MWHDMGYGMWITWVFWIIIIGLIVYLLVRLTAQKGGGGTQGSSETPLDILKKRYARGEISKEEFESMKKDLI